MTLYIPLNTLLPDPAEPAYDAVAFAAGTANATTSLTLTYDSAPDDGERLVLILTKVNAATLGGLSAWTLVLADESGEVPLYVYEREAASEPAGYTVTWTGNDDAVGRIIAASQCGPATFTKTATTPAWAQVGNDLNIAGGTIPKLAAMTSSRVAYYDSTARDLRAYDFDGTNWTQTGNDLNVADATFTALAAMSSTRVAFIDDFHEELRAYDFDGTDWTLAGSGLSVAGFAVTCALAAFSSSRVVFIDATHKTLQAYDFNGATWSAVGTTATISGLVAPFAIAALTGADGIAIVDSSSAGFRAYQFNGAAWSAWGVSFPLSGIAYPGLATLSSDVNSSTVALVDSGTGTIRTYSFDGTWTQTTPALTIAGVNLTTALATLSSTRVAFIDSGNDDLRTYDLGDTANPACLDLSTGSANNLILRLMACAGAPAVTEPAGTTSIAAQASPNSLVTLAAAYEMTASPEAVGEAAFTLAAAQPWATATVAFRAGDENPAAPVYVLQSPVAVNTSFTYALSGAAEAHLYDETVGTYAADTSALNASTHAAYDFGAGKAIRRVVTTTAAGAGSQVWNNTTVMNIRYSDTSLTGPWTTVSGSATQHSITASTTGNPTTDTTDIDANGSHRYWLITYASGTTGGNAWADEISFYTYE